MIEIELIKHLTEQLDVPVYAEVPANPPQVYVVIQRTGGSTEDYIDHASVAIQSCVQQSSDGTGKLASIKLDGTVRRVMGNFIAKTGISACRCTRTYDFTDPETKTYRYQSIFEITYH